MKPIATLATIAILSGTASFAATSATTPSAQPSKAQIAQEQQMTAGIVMNDMTVLWHQQDGHYENA